MTPQWRSEWHNGKRIIRAVPEKAEPPILLIGLMTAVIILSFFVGFSLAESQYEVIDQINQESMHHGQ